MNGWSSSLEDELRRPDGGVAEWLKAPISNIGRGEASRGFKSHLLRIDNLLVT